MRLLPYLSEQKLFGEFHLDEPWDSPHNRKRVDRLPDVFRTPGSKSPEPGRTNYVVAVGPQTVFPGATGVGVQEITDGTSSTLLIVEADDALAVI